jgi:glycosyltransferase involved in cell wall biosynthesis
MLIRKGSGPNKSQEFRRRPRIVFAVTSHISLRLLRGFPEYMHENGWEVHVISSSGPGSDKWIDDGRVTFHAIGMERDPALGSDIRSLIQWIRLCRGIRPDVISVGTPKAGLLGGLAGSISRVPRRIYLQRGLRLETSTGIKRLILWMAERVSVAASHEVVAVSESLRLEMIKLRLTAANKIVVIGRGSSNGVDVREFDSTSFSSARMIALRETLNLHSDKPTIGFVGRLTSDKGFDVLEHAVSELHVRGLVFSLLIVGGVEDVESKKALRRLADSGLAVAATGAVLDPAPYFQLMDLLCLPTYREGYPNVVLDASASGKATVTTNATGAIDSVIPGETGLIVPMGDVSALANALERMLGDADETARMGQKARANVIENYDRPFVWEQLRAYYADQLRLGTGTSFGLSNKFSEGN